MREGGHAGTRLCSACAASPFNGVSATALTHRRQEDVMQEER